MNEHIFNLSKKELMFSCMIGNCLIEQKWVDWHWWMKKKMHKNYNNLINTLILAFKKNELPLVISKDIRTKYMLATQLKCIQEYKPVIKMF